MTFKAGQYIRHAKYGLGTIVERDDDRTTVEFDTAGVRKFVTSLAAFEVAEGQADIMGVTIEIDTATGKALRIERIYEKSRI